MNIWKMMFANLMAVLLAFVGIFSVNAVVVNKNCAIESLQKNTVGDAEVYFRGRYAIFIDALIRLKNGEFLAGTFEQTRGMVVRDIVNTIEIIYERESINYRMRLEESSIISKSETYEELYNNMKIISDTYLALWTDAYFENLNSNF